MSRRALVAGALFLLAGGWAIYRAGRFFEARGRGEAALDAMQPYLRRGFRPPELSARIDQALADSHVALIMALGGPLLVILGLFAALWLSGHERR
jgi:hypothetical protein